MIKLTAPNGDPVWINPFAIERLRGLNNSPARGEISRSDIRNAHMNLSCGEIQIVQETPELINELIAKQLSR